MLNPLQIGSVGPNFSTIGVYKKRVGKIRLSDYHGKKFVILIFYPANFIKFHSQELVRLNQNVSEFRKLSTQIIGISTDSPFSHLRYMRSKPGKGGIGWLDYPLIADSNKIVTRRYGVLSKDGFALPGLFILDKEGRIQYYTVNNLLCRRNLDELLRILKLIQTIKKKSAPPPPKKLRYTFLTNRRGRDRIERRKLFRSRF